MNTTKKNNKIVIFGVTGNQGGAVARHLLKQGYTNLHGIAHSSESPQAKAIAAEGVTLITGEIDDTAFLEKTMQDAYGVFSVLPLDMKDVDGSLEIRRGRAIADAAKKANVRHFIYSSVGGADRSKGVTHFYTKYVIEEYIRDLDLPTTIVRPVFLMENLLTFEHPHLQDGVAVFRVPLHPTTKRQMLAADDIGMIVAEMFDQPDKFIGKALEIAGDELTFPEIVETFTKVTGIPARFEEQPIAEVRAFNEEFANMFTWLNDQGFKADIPTLKRDYPKLSSLEKWLKIHQAAFTENQPQGENTQ